MVHHLARFVDPIGYGAYLAAGIFFGAVNGEFHGIVHRVDAVFPAQDLQALGTLAAGGDLGLHITDDDIGIAGIAADDTPQSPHLFSARNDFFVGEADPLLVDINGIGTPAARGLAAYIRPVGNGRRECQQSAPEKHRHVHRNVGDMVARGIGIVGDDDIPLGKAVDTIHINARTDRVRQRPDKHGHTRRFRPGFAAGRDNREAEVLHVIKQWIVSGAHQGGTHFPGRGNDAVADDFSSDDIQIRHDKFLLH